MQTVSPAEKSPKSARLKPLIAPFAPVSAAGWTWTLIWPCFCDFRRFVEAKIELCARSRAASAGGFNPPHPQGHLSFTLRRARAMAPLAERHAVRLDQLQVRPRGQPLDVMNLGCQSLAVMTRRMTRDEVRPEAFPSRVVSALPCRSAPRIEAPARLSLFRLCLMRGAASTLNQLAAPGLRTWLLDPSHASRLWVHPHRPVTVDRLA